jgi:hypothetical protein
LYQLVLAKERDDSLFVVNQGAAGLPLALLRLGGDNDDDDRQLSGDEWGLETLEPGQCVTAWKEEGNPRAPRGVECEVVGERLERSGQDKFWDGPFAIFFDEQPVGECRRNDDRCEITFTGRD